MKQFFGLLMALGLVFGTLVSDAQPAVANMLNGGTVFLAEANLPRNAVDDKLATEYGYKLDVNNTNVAAFRKYRGLFPTIASKIIRNAPYENLEDILEIPGLSDVEKSRIQENMDIFTLSPPNPALVEGDDRYNNGFYR
ncbi:photosystem II complex extrinsic protein PsbU [Leptolyngbyaceae cyanobacterium CCMR0082]|uniref:Photosystem II extrinsic protein U n=1 Tax=Adonisia turfae CCMR0082 TaxID=2304604 RepID=A0A6M0S059_9CYAN|nr:photosystem II complex extrinsic protein PsbU [Adonisia turfae]MDV3352388.1 photosystem II complex extrinsic protein PsbU [Leptothoe sp. LEGE 181152]NEZ61859.1 photosystem II complex extrinsic protein PsbU [Adonisia turfae CCMR0082]